jgi:group II intron reverse transcriptase/maturase
VNEAIMRHPVNHVIEADIKGFFDNVSHDWMLKFIGHRIADRKFQQLVEKFLKAGYMEEGTLYATEGGTPQGGVISPVLANIYLHYVLDLWIERKVKEESRGYVEMVRYADDFVICVQYKDDAERILSEVRGRLAEFGLELAEEKTRRIEFGRYARQNAKAKGRKPESFDFLGFTYYIGKTRGGAFKVGMKTSRKKLNAKLKEMTQWIKTVRNLLPLKDLWKTLKAKLSGHFQYFGVSGNYREIRTYHNRVLAIILKWLNKRSQKKSFSWKTYGKYLEKYPLPKPQIHHDFYGLKCLFVNVTEEPYVGNLQVRFCEGR